jgi:hypothetical protein
MTAHVPKIGLTAAVLMASCGSQALRKPGVDASVTGGATEGLGGAGGGGGVSSPALGGTGGGGGASSQPARDAAGLADTAAPDAPSAADAPLPSASDAELPDAAATTDRSPAGPPDAAEAGFGEVGSPLAAFCVGSDSKIAYGGQSFVIPVTTKTALSSRSCCMDYEARLHTLEAIGEDLDVVVRPPLSLRAGTYSAEDWSQGFETSLHRSWELPYVQRLMDSHLHGWVVVEDASEDPAQPWQLGLCVSVDEGGARWPGMQIYVTGARVAPAGWSDRFRIWRLKDASLTGQDVASVDIQALELAATPLLDLADFDFVRFESKSCGRGANPCTWMELNTDFILGSALRSKLGSSVDLRGIPFVVEADGERIYVGAFQTSISSIGFPGPGVMVDEIVDEGFALYPPPNFRPLPSDGRKDPRIVKVFTEAGKVVP